MKMLTLTNVVEYIHLVMKLRYFQTSDAWLGPHEIVYVSYPIKKSFMTLRVFPVITPLFTWVMLFHKIIYIPSADYISPLNSPGDCLPMYTYKWTWVQQLTGTFNGRLRPKLLLLILILLLLLLLLLLYCRPRWSRGNVLASRSKVRGFKPSRGRWIF